eukprot:5802097-Karenia_brevis.AAC.1
MVALLNPAVTWVFDNASKKIKANGEVIAYCLRSTFVLLEKIRDFLDVEQQNVLQQYCDDTI